MPALNKSSTLLIILLLISCGAFGGLGVKLARDANRVIAAYQELHLATSGQDDLRRLADTFAATVDSRATVATAWLHGDKLISFIEKLEGLAKKAGVEFKLEEPKPLTDQSTALHLTFRASGSFAGLYYFLTLLENLPYRLDWRSLNWSLVGGTTWSGDFDLAVISYLDPNVTP